MKKRGLTTLRRPGLARNDEPGMTLVEVLIAMGILALIAVIFILGMFMSSRGAITSNASVAVDSLAKSQMEDTKSRTYQDGATTYPTITVPTDLANQHYAITVNAATPTGHTPTDGIQQITVQITRNGQTVFTLVDYKLK